MHVHAFDGVLRFVLSCHMSLLHHMFDNSISVYVSATQLDAHH